jgi:hypothetical protein
VLRLLVVVCLLGCGAQVSAGPEHAKSRSALLSALESGKMDERVGAFRVLAAHDDLGALRIGLLGVRRVLQDRGRILRQIARDVDVFERARAKDMDAEEKVTKAKRQRYSGGRLRLLEAAERRTSSHRKATLAILKDTRAELRTSRALLQSAARQLGGLVRRMSGIERRSALVILREAFMESKLRDAWLLWIDALVASNAPECAGELARVVTLEDAAPSRLRALALDGLVGLDRARAQAAALRWLTVDLDRAWHLAAASIAALRGLRQKSAIPALIAFLARDGIHRLREDAHAALVGLTHQRHGPYAEPWVRWWEEAGATFRMPPAPPKAALAQDGSSTAFYGIHTFSDRIAFVLDLSWSMWHESGGTRRIDAALAELRGAVGTLDESRRFAVVWFGSSAGTWRPRVVPGTEAEKNALERWSRDIDGKGQTNAYDGLAEAFRFARAGAGRPEIDTLFFLTDGAATGGPLKDTADLLGEVRAWSRIERVRIHGIGIGESDPTLLQGLAGLAHGRYVRK